MLSRRFGSRFANASGQCSRPAAGDPGELAPLDISRIRHDSSALNGSRSRMSITCAAGRCSTETWRTRDVGAASAALSPVLSTTQSRPKVAAAKSGGAPTKYSYNRRGSALHRALIYYDRVLIGTVSRDRTSLRAERAGPLDGDLNLASYCRPLGFLRPERTHCIGRRSYSCR